MKKVFDKDYAFFYDIFYRNKDYKKECRFLEDIFKKFSINKPKSILDVACGTGGHANILAKMGYSVTGIDASKHMLKRAGEKAKTNSLKVKYCCMKMQNLKCDKKFDAIISMFSTIDYLTDYKDLERFIFNVRQCLKKDSLFIFDFWNGAVVVKNYTPYKKKKFVYKNLVIERESKTDIFPTKNLCRVNYKVSVLDKATKERSQSRESHLVRYFFVNEMKSILEKNGFSVLGVFPFSNLKRKIKPSDWDITVVAKKRG
ncbi:MAG: class I SAM-dependent methyltransferase [Candidatus Omnitrophica bacterium]|nr:class I SAM-dependent methyltransferase [Candidatus Omnitrophota bacterium]MDD5352451.1 class I SAM-dependent methyltransferase [Candidatus Omnitrophota bacterium]MDD5550049.1 class I SAM-dependent methyltransferase [Candidatus Omnitrophota bacterium]